MIMMKACPRRILITGLELIGVLCFLPILLQGAVINVPRDFSSIRSAVAASRDGDTVEIADGIYFEENIVIDKAVHIRAKNPYGAVIHGSYQKNARFVIFIVQAAAEIEGLILKNGYDGIVQRNSPDVFWSAHDLIIVNMNNSAVSINAVAGNIGRAKVSHIFIDNADKAFGTNDAYSLEVRSCVVFNCRGAFSGSNHLSFTVDNTVVWDCSPVVFSGTRIPPVLVPPATNDVFLGPQVKVLEIVPNPRAGRNPFRNWPNWDNQHAVVQAYVECALSDGFLRTGRFPQAEVFSRSAKQRGERLRNTEILWRSQYGLGSSLEKQGRLQDALANFRQAIQSIAQLQTRIPRTVFRSAFLKDKLDVIGSTLGVLERMPSGPNGNGPAVEALDLIEQTRARGILESMQESIRSGGDPAGGLETPAEEKSLSRAISNIQIELKNESLSEYGKRTLREKLEKAEQAYLDFLTQSGSSTGTNSIALVAPLPYSAIRESLLKAQTVLIEYFFTGKAIFGILATSHGIFLAELPDPDGIAMKVQDYLSFLKSTDSGEFKGRPGGRILADMLLKPFLDRIPPDTRRLIIIPDGFLSGLPFEGLVLPDELGLLQTGAPVSSASRFLFERFEVVYAPSASCLAAAAGRKSRIWAKDWLGLACSKSFPVPILTLGSLAGPPGLPWATKEIKSLAALFHPDRRLMLLNSASGEKNFKEAKLEEFRIIHLATHGILDDINWRRSALLLEADDSAAEDGLLQPREIASLRLNSDLVVLSACQSATGSYETGEGLKGLALAFFTTGARSVLASLWTVSDRSTPVFMKYFYRHLIKGKGKGRALQLAKGDMLRSGYSHPFYWAGYILLGDWGDAGRWSAQNDGSIDDERSGLRGKKKTILIGCSHSPNVGLASPQSVPKLFRQGNPR